MCALRVLVVLLLAVAIGASSATAADPKPAQPVVVKVEEGGFRWEDAGLGAAAGVAATLLVLALVFAVRRPTEGTE